MSTIQDALRKEGCPSSMRMPTCGRCPRVTCAPNSDIAKLFPTGAVLRMPLINEIIFLLLELLLVTMPRGRWCNRYMPMCRKVGLMMSGSTYCYMLPTTLITSSPMLCAARVVSGALHTAKFDMRAHALELCRWVNAQCCLRTMWCS